MNFNKMAELAQEFTIKLAEQQYETIAPEAVKLQDFDLDERDFIEKSAAQDARFPLSGKERSQMKGHGPSNLLTDDNDLDEKIWNRAKKTVKKYWNKYDEPWAVVYDVYRRMGGKSKKKSKKKK